MNKLSTALNRVESLLSATPVDVVGTSIAARNYYDTSHLAQMRKARLAAAKKAKDKKAIAKWSRLYKESLDKLRKMKSKKTKASAITAGVEVWESAYKLMALFKPNLHKLQKLINKGILSPDEVTHAVTEALRSKGVSRQLTDAVSEVLGEVLQVPAGPVIDMPAEEEPGVVESYPAPGIDFM